MNSVASYIKEKSAKLAQSDKDVASGVLQLAVANPNTRQAVYCLEHQIGSTVQAPIWRGASIGESYAEWDGGAGLTWIRLYGITTLNQWNDQGVVVWMVGQNDLKLEMEAYTRPRFTMAHKAPLVCG